MSKNPETLLKEKLIPMLEEIPYSWFQKIQAGSVRGLPDIIGCVNSFFVALELKKSAQEAKKTSGRIVLQRHTLEVIHKKAFGFTAFVTPENFEDVIKELTVVALVESPWRNQGEEKIGPS